MAVVMFVPISRSPSRTLLLWSGAVVAAIASHAVHEEVWFHSSLTAVGAIGISCCIVGAVLAARSRLVVVAVGLCLLALVRYDTVISVRLHAIAMAPVAVDESFIGTVVSAPTEYPYGTVFAVREISAGDGVRRSGTARIMLSPDSASPAFGDRVSWRCVPEAVVPEQGGVGAYLYSRGISWKCRSNRVSIIGSRSGMASSFVHRVRAHIIRTTERVFHEPNASFVLGLLIGAEEGLPEDVASAFRATGTSHVLAVSGYNVVQLIRIIIPVLALCRVRRRLALLLSCVTVGVFAVLVGDDASVMRAAIMGCCMVVAAACGRRYTGTIALACAAALMLMVEPMALRHDVGFALSFSAVIGLHTLTLPFERALRFLRFDIPFVSRVLAETLAATVSTLPVVLMTFGRAPLVGFLANIAIVPLVPLVMAAGVGAILFGSWSSIFATPFVLFANTLLVPMIGLPHAISSRMGWFVTMPSGRMARSLVLLSILVPWFVISRNARRRGAIYAPF